MNSSGLRHLKEKHWNGQSWQEKYNWRAVRPIHKRWLKILCVSWLRWNRPSALSLLGTEPSAAQCYDADLGGCSTRKPSDVQHALIWSSQVSVSQVGLERQGRQAIKTNWQSWNRTEQQKWALLVRHASLKIGSYLCSFFTFCFCQVCWFAEWTELSRRESGGTGGAGHCLCRVSLVKVWRTAVSKKEGEKSVKERALQSHGHAEAFTASLIFADNVHPVANLLIFTADSLTWRTTKSLLGSGRQTQKKQESRNCHV